MSTAADYNRFLHTLLHRADSPAGELDGARLLSSRTVAYMGRNHLPGNRDIEQFGRPINAESPQRGVGFGLGFAVVIDPVEELTAAFFTQLIPSSAHPIRSQLRQLVYQAIL